MVHFFFSCCTEKKEHIERVGFSIWRGQSQASSGRRLTYFCSMCDYVSEQKCNAMRHEIKHSQIRPYECNICGKAYTENRGLKRHRASAHPEVADDA
jgi:rubredoxin